MPLQIAFSTRFVRELCESESRAAQELGTTAAAKLKARLSDLRAATAVRDLVAAEVREIQDAGSDLIAITLCEGYSLLLCANHPQNPLDDSGRVDWSAVSRIKVMEIKYEDA